MINLCLNVVMKVFVFLLISFIVKSETTRNLTTQLNPDCDRFPECRESSDNNLIYVKAVGSNDTLHYLWSTLGGIPSALIVQTTHEAILQVNWTNLLSKNHHTSISFTEKPLYSFGVVLTKIYMYNDTNDKADMSLYVAEAMDLSDVTWIDITSTSVLNNSNYCSVTFKTNSTESFLLKGSLSFQLSAFGGSGRGEKFSHLLHNADNIEINIILDKLLAKNKTSRYGVEFVVMYSDTGYNSQMKMKEHITLDDEYSPGTFTIVDLNTSLNTSSNSYFSWKPVAYTVSEATVAHSVDVKIYDIVPSGQVPFSIVEAYFEFNNLTNIASWNISFGTIEDGFYKSTFYTYWSLTIGLGVPPEDKPSLFLILTIAIGFGMPFVCILGGSVYMGLRKLLKKEDDLLLSRDSM